MTYLNNIVIELVDKRGQKPVILYALYYINIAIMKVNYL